MRKINLSSIVVFCTLLCLSCVLSFKVSERFVGFLELRDSNLVFQGLVFVLLLYVLNILFYRIFLMMWPVKVGWVDHGGIQEMRYNIYVLYYLILFNALLPTFRWPVPLMRLIYLGLGAHLGPNTYSAGVILDPPLVQIGSNTILGFDSLICPHSVEGRDIYFSPIFIGDNVTVGMRSTVMAGVRIENDCIVAAGSIVIKGSHLRKGEIWGGVPARKIGDRKEKSIPAEYKTS